MVSIVQSNAQHLMRTGDRRAQPSITQLLHLARRYSPLNLCCELRQIEPGQKVPVDIISSIGNVDEEVLFNNYDRHLIAGLSNTGKSQGRSSMSDFNATNRLGYNATALLLPRTRK
jgi:hypothetical protein